MPSLVVSQNSALLRHLTSAPFRQLSIDLHVAANGEDAVALAASAEPALAILDAELAKLSGYEAARQIKAAQPGCKVVLVLGKRITSSQLESVTAAGCDEVLIAPMSADELYDVVAVQLGVPRRGSEKFSVTIAVLEDGGEREIDAQVSNLSVDGARLVLPELLPEGTRLRVSIMRDGDAVPTELAAQVLWAQQSGEEVTAGASFPELDEATRKRLMRLTLWEIIEEPERVRVVIKGDITETTGLLGLASELVGRVDFDLSQVSYINSLGVRSWIRFLRALGIQGYELHACSVPFVLQASVIPAMVGRGVVVSFFAPYHCEGCEHNEDRLLQSAAILAADRVPPSFQCPSCGDTMQLDDLPERYLAFLRPPLDEP
ncbi:PilZ domain-containing protein [Haliangium ochraceum]|uniref:Response regulator receiver modulated PilZ sensor protein n=1 Tax=Haliangium ochraceum (strain DSM 14365 / JCM 11303 / SMP-2) TaxID=502025 RepID=D0LT32_HALO1|nr:PilZ domain-containing protein [Haliangium ochraceum]ACY19168.1 response regulator receiver modulated PilZ sensor protein [Haliangium ochraceum DSM 14365]